MQWYSTEYIFSEIKSQGFQKIRVLKVLTVAAYLLVNRPLCAGELIYFVVELLRESKLRDTFIFPPCELA